VVDTSYRFHTGMRLGKSQLSLSFTVLRAAFDPMEDGGGQPRSYAAVRSYCVSERLTNFDETTGAGREWLMKLPY